MQELDPLKEILREILTGKYDRNLDAFGEVIRRRREYLSQIKFIDFEVGQIVRFNNQTRPTYLQGLKARITKKNNKKVVVDLLIPAGRFSRNIATSTSLIEKVETE